MYQLNPKDSQYGRHIHRTVLAPLMLRGSTWFCSFTFRNPHKSYGDEFIEKHIIPTYCINLARQSQSIITPFVGWWSYKEDKGHQLHIHAAIHSSNPEMTAQLLLDEWKHLGELLAHREGQRKKTNQSFPCITGHRNKVVPFDSAQDGLAYIYGGHQRRSEPYFQHPFTPPIDHKTGEWRAPVPAWRRLLAKRTPHNPHKIHTPRIIRRPKV